MTAQEKKRLLDLLTETHAVTRAALTGIDPAMRVYGDTNWQVKDIVGHLAAWDRQVVLSLQAFQAGQEYVMSDLDEDAFNEQAVRERRKLSVDQVFEEWGQVHLDFKQAIQDIPSDHFHSDLLYPWGDERGSITELVEYMIEHDVEHRNEILKAPRTSKEG